MPNPEVSVVIPTCDRDPRLSIQSVLDQTYQDFEILVYFDGDPDLWMKLTRELFSAYKFTNFVLISKFKKYRGASAARNEGIKIARGEFIAFCDDDDIYLPEHLKYLVKYMSKNLKTDIVFSKGWGIKSKECNVTRAEIWIEELSNGKWKGILPGQYYQPERIFWDSIAPLPCFLIRKKCFEHAGLFNEGLRSLNDFELINRFALSGFTINGIDEFTIQYSVHGKGINSKDPDKTAKIAQAIRRRSQCKAWKRGLIRS